MSTKFHVGTSPITHRIYAGRLLKDGETWAGEPTDVTVEALVAVADRVIGRGQPGIVTVDGVPTWEISVRVISPAGKEAASAGSSIFGEIAAEMERATVKFPTWPTDALHAVGVVAEEMGELQKEVMQLTYEPHKSTPDTVRKEAVQLAAMSLRFLMSLGRYKFQPSHQHSQNAPRSATPEDKQ